MMWKNGMKTMNEQLRKDIETIKCVADKVKEML